VPSRSTADHSVSPPAVRVPRDYNAAYDLIERNLAAGRAAKLAYVDDAGQYTFGQLAERVDRFGSGLRAMGLEMEHRVCSPSPTRSIFPRRSWARSRRESSRSR